MYTLTRTLIDQLVRVFVILRVMLNGLRHMALPPKKSEAVATVEVAHPLRVRALATRSLLPLSANNIAEKRTLRYGAIPLLDICGNRLQPLRAACRAMLETGRNEVLA